MPGGLSPLLRVPNVMKRMRDHASFVSVYGIAMVVVAMIGKLAVSILFSFAYFWSSEVFPSTLRTTLVGFCSLMARVGSMAAPAIVDLVSNR